MPQITPSNLPISPTYRLQGSVDSAMKAYLDASFAQFVDRVRNSFNSPKYQKEYRANLNAIDRARTQWFAARRKALPSEASSYSPTNSTVYVDDWGMPYRRDGTVTIVIGNSRGRPVEGRKASYDPSYNRITIDPQFAFLMKENRVKYLDSKGNLHDFNMRDLIHHEFGHYGDQVNTQYGPFSTNGGRIINGGTMGDDVAERMQQIGNAVSNEPVALPHGHLVFVYADGTIVKGPYPIEGVPGNPDLNAGTAYQKIKARDPGFPIDPNGVPPELGVIRDLKGQYHVVTSRDGRTAEIKSASVAGGQIGRMAGSSLGNYLSGNSGAVAQIASSTVLGAIGQTLGNALAIRGTGLDLSKSFDAAFQDFDSNLYSNLKGAAVGAVTAFTTMELGRALGLKGFGAELFGNVSGTTVGPILDKVLTNLAGGQTPFSNFSLKDIFGGNAAFGDLLGAGVASFLGAKLGSLVISPTTSAGAALASFGSAAGAYALSAAGSKAIGGLAAHLFSKLGVFANVFGPGIGAFVGFVLGALIGKLFGGRKPRIPSASADVVLNLSSSQYFLGAVTVSNNGNRALVTSMAETARDTLNTIISQVVGGDVVYNGNTYSPTQTYGHDGNQLRARFLSGPWQNFQTADAAVEWGILNAIQATKIRGGNIIQKRLIAAPSLGSLTSLLGNMQLAHDYELYLNNRTTINSLIRDDPNSELSAAWIATLGRIAELGANDFKASDFNGGLMGFTESFGFGFQGGGVAFGSGYENITVSIEGSAVRFGVTDGSSPFDILVGSNNIQDPGVAGQSAYITDVSKIGYNITSGQASSGNDIWVAGNGGPLVMDDMATQYYGYWDPYYGYYYQYPVTVSGGDDIFVGSDFNDTLYGRTGWDWLDGGAGDDLIDGGENDDVLLGRAGNDRMLGGNGNDYLAGGDGDDYFFDAGRTWGLYGGEGNDVMVGGSGMDSLYGENGDDVILVDQDGGNTWDALGGAGGQDTLSYERFTQGVYVDFAVLGGWSWDPTAKYIYGDAISGMENVTGTKHDDVILGDSAGNRIRGLDGADYIDGREGDDVIEGGADADIIRGGLGVDVASYAGSADGVVIDLGLGVALSGDAAGDTFDSIEGVEGSQHADKLAGSDGDDILRGGKGRDVIVITAGSDIVDGGDDFDTLDASEAQNPLSVYYDQGYYDYYSGYQYPGAGWVATIGNGTTTFAGIEGFLGTAFSDSISGSNADEVFEGGAGNDYLVGAGGSDTFVFGRGDGQDTVYSSSDGASAIVLKEEIDWRDVSIIGADYSQQYANLTVTIRGTSDQMTVGGNFSYVNSGNTAGQHSHAIKSLSLGGVSTIDIDTIDWTPYAADDASTVVYGAQNRSDLIFAYGGDDTIFAAGNSYAYETRGNVIYAGDGADTIYSSAGDDQFIFERGNGADTLIDGGGADTIVMGPSVSADDVIYEVVSYGSSADLFIGIRDSNNPNATASQVADRIRVVDGGMKYIGTYYGGERLNTVEHVRVGGQEIDLTKANINWAIGYEYDGGGYYGGGGGGWGGGGGGYNIPPIAIDLDGDGIELRSVEGSRIATVAADGTITRMGWLGQDDGFLALDRDGNGVIDRIGEISFIGDKPGAKTDLEALAAYDTNGDDRFDASDTRWGEFTVWQDRNQDGFGSTDELLTLEQAGIASISLKGQLTGFTAADGPDNVVIATTEVGWADPNRIGSAYDVALAQLQVRTDEGGAEVASIDAAARGGQIEGAEAQLRGIQTLSEEQVAALREKRGQKKTSGDGGLLYRVEDLLDGNATAVANGLLTIDPKMAKSIADAGRALGMIDRYADSAWTQLGSIAPGEADMRGTDVRVEKRKLGDAEKAAIAAARTIVGDRAIADAGKAAEMAIGDAANAVATPPPVPSTAAELERLKRLDTFRLLEKESGNDPSDAEEDAASSELMRQSAASDASQMPDHMAAPLPSEDLMVPEIAVQDAPRSAPAETIALQPAIDDTLTGGGTAEAVDADVYGVVIRTANARLVQALAGFGDAPTMMASYQGVNVANDPQSAWLSVDAMPSVQRLAMIR